jgi:hypothetical protein
MGVMTMRRSSDGEFSPSVLVAQVRSFLAVSPRLSLIVACLGKYYGHLKQE